MASDAYRALLLERFGPVEAVEAERAPARTSPVYFLPTTPPAVVKLPYGQPPWTSRDAWADEMLDWLAA